MFSFTAESVNEALQYSLEYLFHSGIKESSRNGPVLVAPGPVCVQYTHPRNRVLYSPTRDANPVFHLMESLWILAGDKDIEFPTYFSSTYGQYSDDGVTMWDAYGWRWRRFFGWDQLEGIVKELKRDPTSRRCVLSMWSAAKPGEPNVFPSVDDFCQATHGGKAVPCNTHAYFAVRQGRLNMTVMNRSNDLIWGMCGANAVHFSFLLEYMAMRTGVPMGSYYQFTNNLHCYTDKFSLKKLSDIAYDCATVGALPETGYAIEPGFDEDLKLFMEWARKIIRYKGPTPSEWASDGPVPESAQLTNAVPDCKTPFMYSVAIPMLLFWVFRKWKDPYSSQIALDGIDAPDWQKAVSEWVDRRKK